MSSYIFSRNDNYIDYWNDCVEDAKVIEKKLLVNLLSSDILLIDYALYHEGIETKAKLIVLDAEPTLTKCMKLLENSVKAYGNIYMHKSHILSAIESLKDNKIWIYPNFLATMIATSKKSNQDLIDEKIIPLTLREKEIAKLVLNGLTNKEIAKKLTISINTIKIHTKNIYQKLNVTDRLSLFAYLS